MPENTLRILVVEDRANVSALISRILEQLQEDFPKLAIQCVTTLAGALAIIRADPPPDIVTLDLALADATPEKTLSCVPEIEERCPVVILTGNKVDGFTDMLNSLQVEVIRKGESWLDDNRIVKAVARAFTRGAERELRRQQTRMEKMRKLLTVMYHPPSQSNAP